MTTKLLLLSALGVVTVIFLATWAISLARRGQWRWPSPIQTAIGFVTNFFDTLGIGSFAPTTALYRLKKVISDDLLPGTLNVGHSLPIILQAMIFTTIIQVDERTLVLMIASSVLGAWIGSAVVVRFSKRMIQMGLGCALLVATGFLVDGLLGYQSAGGQDLGLTGGRLIVGLVANFVFGALMMIGVGAYAPIMITVSLLSMDPKAAFPIMMCSCAFISPIGGLRFIRQQKYDPKAALGLTLGGIPAVLIAAYVVKELRLDVVRWLVVCVATYTAIGLLYSATRQRAADATLEPQWIDP